MSLEDHKALSRRHIHLWDDGSTDSPEEIFTPSYVNHQDSDVEGAGARGLEAFKDLVRGYHEAFSNSQVKVLTQIAEGDYVATRWQITATNTGDYMDLAKATNKSMTWTGVLVDRFEGGKIAETWVEWDQYRFFQGLGIVK
ncbi:MAG: ester cyclase [Pseudomonadota bacterium]